MVSGMPDRSIGVQIHPQPWHEALRGLHMLFDG
jgi:hypothetical protein